MKHDFELLYFRHSIAEDYHAGGDRLRQLTKEGQQQMRGAAEALVAAGLVYDTAVSSPYVRAMETARIVGGVFGCNELLEDDALIPAADPRDTMKAMFEMGRSSGSTIAAFGHNPSITSTVSWMLGGEGRAAYLSIAPGDLVHLRVMGSPFGGPEAVLLGFYKRQHMSELGGRL